MSSYTIWLHGLPSSGKTTLANALFSEINAVLLDGDDLRKHLQLEGFSNKERNRIAQIYCGICNLINNSNIDCILCTNSITEENRNIFRDNINNLIDVYVSCPIEECIKRDTKGLYKKAIDGLINNMPGIDMKFEEPHRYDIILFNDKMPIDIGVKEILICIKAKYCI